MGNPGCDTPSLLRAWSSAVARSHVVLSAEASLTRPDATVVRCLDRVSLAARHLFSCPTVQQHRRSAAVGGPSVPGIAKREPGAGPPAAAPMQSNDDAVSL